MEICRVFPVVFAADAALEKKLAVLWCFLQNKFAHTCKIFLTYQTFLPKLRNNLRGYREWRDRLPGV